MQSKQLHSVSTLLENQTQIENDSLGIKWTHHMTLKPPCLRAFGKFKYTQCLDQTALSAK
jgi:hypothetical protein